MGNRGVVVPWCVVKGLNLWCLCDKWVNYWIPEFLCHRKVNQNWWLCLCDLSSDRKPSCVALLQKYRTDNNIWIFVAKYLQIIESACLVQFYHWLQQYWIPALNQIEILVSRLRPMCSPSVIEAIYNTSSLSARVTCWRDRLIFLFHSGISNNTVSPLCIDNTTIELADFTEIKQIGRWSWMTVILLQNSEETFSSLLLCETNFIWIKMFND